MKYPKNKERNNDDIKRLYIQHWYQDILFLNKKFIFSGRSKKHVNGQ